MSVRKYGLAREIRNGAAARILNQAITEPCSPAFMVGFAWASKNMGDLHDLTNVFLKSIGEKEIEMIELLRKDECKINWKNGNQKNKDR